MRADLLSFLEDGSSAWQEQGSGVVHIAAQAATGYYQYKICLSHQNDYK
jgi:hypothetical protein